MTTRYLIFAAITAWTLARTHKDNGAQKDNHAHNDNQAPVVKIQSPAPHTTVARGTPVPYEITVTDKEDGDSRYDEINPREVVLMIQAPAAQTAATASKTTTAPSPAAPSPLRAPGLALMARSNCFNCHQFNGKLIGPSLADISRRYHNTATDTLTKRIKDGSAGIWGKEKMPSHPELSTTDIHAMVQWIEKYAAAHNVIYQNGISGVLQFPAPGTTPATPASNTAASGTNTGATPAAPGTTPAAPGDYILTAAYTDHGAKDTKTGPYLTGLDQLTLTVK